ncbi:MAG TPA: DUF2442 domain-containing protein [Candidatus Binatia bacterium]|jgi:hypothetical protein|nr:DUF2442 domain-containing protein [Candidatus Binatia bacterium]
MITIEEKKTKRMPKVVRIERVCYAAAYKLRIWFDNGHEVTVDFGPFLKRSLHPSIRAYLDFERFKNFTVEEGMLHWNDFDLVFPIADLYQGKIA